MNLSENNTVMNISSNYVTDDQISRNKWKPIDSNTIIFAKVGAAVFLERKRQTRCKFLIDNNMMSYKPNSIQDHDYIYYTFQNLNLSHYAQIGSLPSLNARELKNVNIVLPDQNEQSKVSQLFLNLDRTITLHEEKQRQLEQLKKALLQKMFADKTGYPVLRFKGFSIAWEQHKLSKLTTKIGTGKSKYKLQDNGRYPILGSTSVIGYDNNFDYTGDFILTARVGANAGNLYRFSGSVKITDNTVFIKSKYNKFLYYYLQKYDLKKLSFGTGQPLVKASDLKNLKILKPRLDEEIYRISKLLLSVDNLITHHQHKIDNLKLLKRALLQKMFV